MKIYRKEWAKGSFSATYMPAGCFCIGLDLDYVHADKHLSFDLSIFKVGISLEHRFG